MITLGHYMKIWDLGDLKIFGSNDMHFRFLIIQFQHIFSIQASYITNESLLMLGLRRTPEGLETDL